MKERLNENAVGLTFGSAAATLHALWVIAVGAGFGQALADWWHSVHFLSDMHVPIPRIRRTDVIGSRIAPFTKWVALKTIGE